MKLWLGLGEGLVDTPARVRVFVTWAGVAISALHGCDGVRGPGSSTDRSDAGNASGSSSGSPSESSSDRDWAQWPMPNSLAEVAAGAPHPESYTDRGDGTVTDDVTRLLWQKAVSATSATWADALSQCAGLTLAGQTGWRLPTYVELVSIVDYSQQTPAIDTAYFPSTPSDYFWSSTPLAGSPNSAWFVNFGDGDSSDYGHYDVSLTHDVRCVLRPADTTGETGRYIIASDTAYDMRTRLTWQRIAPSGSYLWPDAKSYCASLTLSGTGWRLPTAKELVTIVDVLQANPAIDPLAFPGTAMGYFWSSTPTAGSASNAWLVDFGGGGAAYAFGATSVAYNARCVR